MGAKKLNPNVAMVKNKKEPSVPQPHLANLFFNRKNPQKPIKST